MYVGVAVGIFGAFKCVSIWKQFQGARLRDEERRRRQEEELGSLRHSLSESRAEVQRREKAVLSLTEEIERLGKRVLEAERELDTTRRQNRTLTDRSMTLATQHKQLESDLNRTKAEQKQTSELLSVRTVELKGAQAFLTKADQLSGADIIKLVEELNTEIMQTAATMAEELAINEKKIDAEGKEQESDESREASTRTEEIVGSRMTELLKVSEHHEDPILIQIAFQTGMVAYAHWMISSWCFESPEDEHMLSEIYARVREAGEYLFLLSDFLPLLTSIRRTSRIRAVEAVDKNTSSADACTGTRLAIRHGRSIGPHHRDSRLQGKPINRTRANHDPILWQDSGGDEASQAAE